MLNLGLNAISVQLSRGTISVPICTKAVWDMIRTCDGSDEAVKKISGVLLKGTPLNYCDARLLLSQYREGLLKIRSETGLEMPFYPAKSEKDDIKYTVYTQTDKLVADYANMSIYDVDGLSVIDYWLLERDAFISVLSQTEKGREYLNNAYRLTQTEADEDLEIG